MKFSSKKETRDDEEMREEILEILFQNPVLEPSEIDVEVENGIVTLKGSVPNKLGIFEAESSLEEVSGVKEIINLLKSPSTHLSLPI